MKDPEFVIRQAVIVTPYSGATSQEFSDEVTDVIEGAVQSLQELKEVKSVSKQGCLKLPLRSNLSSLNLKMNYKGMGQTAS